MCQHSSINDHYNSQTSSNHHLSQLIMKKTINLPHLNQLHMKKLFIQCVVLSLLFFSNKAIAQGPYPNTGDHTVCLNSTQPYGVALNAGSSYSWTVTSLTGGDGTITQGATPNLITV